MPQPSLGAGAMPPLGAEVKTPPYGRGYLFDDAGNQAARHTLTRFLHGFGGIGMEDL